MKALITGASSGIGKDIAIYLDGFGYELVLVARSEDKLKEICKNLKKAEYCVCDLSKREDCFTLYDKFKNANIDFLVNNAGYGLFGYFDETDMQKELDMIDLNVTAVHILTKLFKGFC